MMQRCFQLAKLGIGRTAANPLVGCVIAHDDRLIAEGYHREFGGAHAEVDALSRVKSGTDLSEAVLYVNLEPCSHHGKTPPCTGAILKSGIRKVVVACKDPNPLVAGTGISFLRDAGVEVVTDILKEQAIQLNRRFFVNQLERRPYVVLKWAQTNDGFIDKLRSIAETGQFQISGATSAAWVHRWRAELGAVWVGRNTVEIDDPQLNVRYVQGPSPTRIVWDSDLKLTGKFKIFSTEGRVIVLNTHKEGNSGNVFWVRFKDGTDSVIDAMHKLYELGVHSVLVEGGAVTLRRILDAGCWDEARSFIASDEIFSGVASPIMNVMPEKSIMIGRDILQYFHRINPESAWMNL
jgi:diaminohydroxyphosphoribosylaminopyrimidine deaminase/5-amino-6-(5-phosphoribosylamino)uracil reductase